MLEVQPSLYKRPSEMPVTLRRTYVMQPPVKSLAMADNDTEKLLRRFKTGDVYPTCHNQNRITFGVSEAVRERPSAAADCVDASGLL